LVCWYDVFDPKEIFNFNEYCDLIFMTSNMKPKSYYIINGITLYRLIAAPLLLLILLGGNVEVFKWGLALSFFTDAIDGFLARRFKVTSQRGAKLDSIADDLTVGVGVAGVFIIDPAFIKEHVALIILLLGLFVVENIVSYIRFHRLSSFHTYLAKAAAVCQAAFILTFFFFGPIEILFYIAVVATAADLIEEIILVFVLPRWKVNVPGLPWVIKNKK